MIQDIFFNPIADNNQKMSEGKRFGKTKYSGKTPAKISQPSLWIGCFNQDSKADGSKTTQPSEQYLTTNFNTTDFHADLNMLSVVEYAVNILKIQHIVLCGNATPGCITTTLGKGQSAFIDNQTADLNKVIFSKSTSKNQDKNDNERFDNFVALNVKEQIYKLAKTNIVQTAWKNGQKLYLHGYIYGHAANTVIDLDLNLSDNHDLHSAQFAL